MKNDANANFMNITAEIPFACVSKALFDALSVCFFSNVDHIIGQRAEISTCFHHLCSYSSTAACGNGSLDS